jgi:hypothetical protein
MASYKFVELGNSFGSGRYTGGQPTLFCQRREHFLVATHCSLDHGLVVGKESVLLEHAHGQLLGEDKRALTCWLLAGNDAKERCLAAAVGPNQAVASTPAQVQIDARKERPGTK